MCKCSKLVLRSVPVTGYNLGANNSSICNLRVPEVGSKVRGEGGVGEGFFKVRNRGRGAPTPTRPSRHLPQLSKD
jgi:hypothetical protein